MHVKQTNTKHISRDVFNSTQEVNSHGALNKNKEMSVKEIEQRFISYHYTV